MTQEIPFDSEAYKICKFLTPTSLLASQRQKSRARRAKRITVHDQPLTYRSLKESQAEQAAAGLLNLQTHANRLTALNGFMRICGMNDSDLVGRELRMQFTNFCGRYRADLNAAGRSHRSVTNTLSALRSWKELVLAHDRAVAASNGEASPFCIALNELLRGRVVKHVAKEAGVRIDMLNGWLHGAKPRASNARYISRLESYFGIERDQLAGLLQYGVSRGEVTVGEPVNVAHRARLRELRADPYTLRPEAASPLRRQWAELVAYKTAAVPALRRTAKGQWRLAVRNHERERPYNWFGFQDGVEVPSAFMAWNQVSSYLGWLCRSPDKGGIGLCTDEASTLAWLAVPDYLQRYLDWSAKRAGVQANEYTFVFLGTVSALCRPEYGFLTQRSDLQATLPERYRAGPWEALCRRQFDLAEALCGHYRGRKRMSRHPFHPLQAVIDLEQPMTALVDMVARMQADRPVGARGLHEAAWARDMVLIKLLISNPLRLRNLGLLTWTPDNLGELYQHSDGSWWIRIDVENFKNASGAAAEGVYDSPVQEFVWPDIERYIEHFRPMLIRRPNSLFFLTANQFAKPDAPHEPWRDMSQRVHALTKRYLLRCPGVGTHAFRHLVATAILKASPNDYKTAALILNDRMSTVERTYAHLRSQDATRRVAELLKEHFARM